MSLIIIISKMEQLLELIKFDPNIKNAVEQFKDNTVKSLKKKRMKPKHKDIYDWMGENKIRCFFARDEMKFIYKGMFHFGKHGVGDKIRYNGKNYFDELVRQLYLGDIITMLPAQFDSELDSFEMQLRNFNWSLVGGLELKVPKPPKRNDSEHKDSSVEVQDTTPANGKVLTKYNMAAKIVNNVLKELVAEVKDGAKIGQLCSLGDKRMVELTGNLFKRQKKVQKGIAMPTCISVDNCVCHFSPLKSEPPVLLKDGQVVKVDLGVHVDGYIATAAHTVVVGASKDNKVTGKKANAILSAYNAMEMVLRMLKPAKELKNMDITDRIGKLAKIYETTPIENMLSHQVERFKTVGDKQIIQNPGDEQKSKTEKCTFANHEVYTIDILISSGEGKAKTDGARITVFKKVADMVYNLKLKASPIFGSMPFPLKYSQNKVLYERDGEFVAQFKCTAIIMPSGIYKITGLPLDRTSLECHVKIENEEIQALLSESLKEKKKPATGTAKKEGEGEKKEESGKVKVEQKKEESGGKVGGAEAKKEDENSKKEKSAKTKKTEAK